MENIWTNYDRMSLPLKSIGDVMSIYISRFVETTLKERTTAYSALVEAIVNSIEAIIETGRKDGKVIITPIRNPQISLKSGEDKEELPDIIGFTIEDNGIGFNKQNRDAFDTLCTDYKINLGGIGLGRFIFLKYFNRVKFSSIYRDNGNYRLRTFKLGLKNNIVDDEKDNKIEASDTKTTLSLEDLKKFEYDKQLSTIARKILERILVFFINKDFKCPKIILKENTDEVILNDLLEGNKSEIQHINSSNYTLYDNISQKQQEFKMETYKINYPRNINSKLCLTAHNRLVMDVPLYKHIPEFKEDFFEKDDDKEKNYIIMSYILGCYLDDNVSFERSKFNFPLEERDSLYALSQKDVEKGAVKIIENLFKNQVQVRREKKISTIRNYVNDSAPWHKPYLRDIDYTTLPYEPDDKTMETALQQVKFNKEQEARTALKRIIDNPKGELDAKADELVKNLHEAGISDLTHYVALRKIVLDLLKKLLEIKDDEKYNKEAQIHSLIFPMKKDSEHIQYEEHNLWILDEKLNFTELVSSDKGAKKEGRADLLIYNKKWVYRSGDGKSNPITIFEFKQPQRDDFADKSAEEDPVDQIIRYTREIKEGKHKTSEGRDIYVDENTPFYGFVVCDFTPKVRNWIHIMKDFIPMPDGLGYMKYFANSRLYIEVLAWDKILKDAEQRNKIFFKKLGLS